MVAERWPKAYNKDPNTPPSTAKTLIDKPIVEAPLVGAVEDVGATDRAEPTPLTLTAETEAGLRATAVLEAAADVRARRPERTCVLRGCAATAVDDAPPAAAAARAAEPVMVIDPLTLCKPHQSRFQSHIIMHVRIVGSLVDEVS